MANWQAELIEAAGDVAKEAVVVSLWLAAIFLVGEFNRILSPPDGLVMFRHTAVEFPLKWVIEAGEIANVALFIVRGFYKISIRSWR